MSRTIRGQADRVTPWLGILLFMCLRGCGESSDPGTTGTSDTSSATEDAGKPDPETTPDTEEPPENTCLLATDEETCRQTVPPQEDHGDISDYDTWLICAWAGFVETRLENNACVYGAVRYACIRTAVVGKGPGDCRTDDACASPGVPVVPYIYSLEEDGKTFVGYNCDGPTGWSCLPTDTDPPCRCVCEPDFPLHGTMADG